MPHFCFSLRLRNQRRSLINKLLRHGKPTADINKLKEIRIQIIDILKELDLEQLNILLQSVVLMYTRETPCLLLESDDDYTFLETSDSRRVRNYFCIMWRWPDLDLNHTLKPNPLCSTIKLSHSENCCCNPYHCSIVRHIGDTSFIDGLLSLCISSADKPANHCWLRVSYWEMRDRVGNLLPVTEPSIHIFQHLESSSHGLCLLHIQKQCHDRTVISTREKICSGVMVFRELHAVWLYNLSSHPVFVYSPLYSVGHLTHEVTSDKSKTSLQNASFPSSSKLSPIVKILKLQSGECQKIFDLRLLLEDVHRMLACTGQPKPDNSSALVSFVKGWGPQYSRQFITSCPCWLSLHFS